MSLFLFNAICIFLIEVNVDMKRHNVETISCCFT